MSELNDSNIEYVRVEKIPLELECFLDIAEGNGIRLTSVESFDKKNQKINTGLQSEFFGTDFSSDWAFKERYSCKCGKYLGKAYSKLVCDQCGTTVEYQDIDLNKTGWVILDNHKVISPIYSAKIAEALGKVDSEYILRLILARRYHPEGEIDYKDKELQLVKKHPFILKGMTWFREHYVEVMEYYMKKKPTKRELFEELIAEKDLVWTNSIPIYTSLLRTEMPGEKGSKNFKLKINTQFKAIIRLANSVNEYGKAMDYDSLNTIDIYLAGIQKSIDATFEINYTDLTDKSGTIASKVLSGRYNFSSRNIIVPDSGLLRSDEIAIGYVPFMELYRYEIQNLYRKMYECTPSKANTMWKRALHHFDPKFYNIMDSMCKDKKYNKYLGVLVSRNPCINYGSFMYLNIRYVKKDISDKTMTLSTHIIVPFNADFDGDVMNIHRQFSEYLLKKFAKNLNPRYNMMVSRMDGKINPETLPQKDEMTCFWAFNNI